MKQILVTGATGFIGSRLVSELIRKGYSATTLVRNGKHTEIYCESKVLEIKGSSV